MNINHARYTHTRGTKISTRLIFTIAIVAAIVFCMAFFGVYERAASADVQDVMNIGTYLSTGDGLVLGANVVRPTTSNAEEEYLTGASSSTSRFGDDFYFDLTTSDWDDVTGAEGALNRVGYTTDGFYLNYYTDSTDILPNARSFFFQSKIRLTAGSTLATALQQTTGRVEATVSLDYQYYNKVNLGHETEADAYEDSFDFEVFWAPNGVVSKTASYNYVISSDKKTAEISVTLDTAGFDPTKAYLLIKIADFETHGADKVVESTQDKYTTGIFARFSNVNVSVVNVTDYTMSFHSTGARVVDSSAGSRDDAYTIYSSDDSVYFESEIVTADSTLYALSDGDIYLKDNDVLYLYSDVYMQEKGKDAVRMPLSADYSKSVNSTGKAIQWTYTQDEYFETFSQNLILYEYSNTADQTSGRTTVYRVNYQDRQPGSERMLELRPKIISSYYEDEDNPGVYIYNEVTLDPSKYTKIYIDNVRPETPVVASDSSSTLGYYGYNTAIYGDISEQNIEKRYTDGMTVSFTLSNYNDINTKTGTAVAPEGIYYTVNGDNPTSAKSVRYRASLSSSGTAQINLNTPANGGVGRGSGFYEIKLVTIDAAGNYSDVVTYKIVVDNKKYEVNTYIVGGLSSDAKLDPKEPNVPSSTKMVATIAMSQNKDSSNISEAAKRSYNRGSEVVLKVEMSAEQMSNYQLVSVYNAGLGESLLSWSGDDIEFVKEGSKYAYYVRVKLDKYIDPYLDEEGNVLGYRVTTADDDFYVYDGVVYSQGAGGVVSDNHRIGSYNAMLGIISLDGGAYAASPRLYRIILEGEDKGLYALTEDASGEVLYDGTKYTASLVGNTLVSIDSKTVDLIGTSAGVRNFYFAFKQKVAVDITNTVVTFDYTPPTASTVAIAKAQSVNLDPKPASSNSLHPDERFAGLKEDFEVSYYRLDSTLYKTMDSLMTALGVSASSTVEQKAEALEAAIAAGYVVLYQEGGVAAPPREAGEYWYTATISVTSQFNSDYFYLHHGVLTILKANPQVSGSLMFGEVVGAELVARPLVYGTGGMETMDKYLYGYDDNNMPSNTVTTIGVMGKYSINTNNTDYLNPSSGVHLVTVTFTPDDVNVYGNNKYAILNSSNIDTISTILVQLTVAKASVSIEVDEDSLTTEYNKSRQVIDVKLRLHDDLQYMSIEDIPNLPGSSIVVNSNLTIDTSNIAVKYLFRTNENEVFSESEPVNAGLYDVKVVVTGDNYQGELILSDRYCGTQSRVEGYYDGEYVIGGEVVDVPVDNSTVSGSIHGYVIGGVAYYLVGDRAVTYTSTAEQVAVTSDGSIYTVYEDGVPSRYAEHRGVFYSLTAVESSCGVAVYEKNSILHYSNYYVIGKTTYYYDNAYVYSDAELTTRVGNVEDGRVLVIDGTRYMIDRAKELSTMQETTAIADGGLATDLATDSATATIYVYNGDFSYNGDYYIVSANSIYKRMIFEITKKTLLIESGFEESYDYTYYSVPAKNSAMYAYSMVLADDGQMRPEKQAVEFSLAYYYSATADGEYSLVTETDVTKFSAGYYKVDIDIVATNYQGRKTDNYFRIKRGGLQSAYITVNQPQVSILAGLDGNATYGQTIADLVLSSGNSVNVKYQGKTEVITVGVSSNYRPAIRTADYDDYTYYGIDVLGEKTYADTVFDAVGTRAEGYYIIFVPDDLVNFEPFAVTLIVNVVAATPLSHGDKDGEWDATFLKAGTTDPFITYGDKFSSAVLNAGGKAVTAGSGALFFYYGAEKRAVDGKFSTTTSANTVLAAGEHVISYTFVPTDTKKFRSVNFEVTLTVVKKALSVTYQDSTYTLPYGGGIDIVNSVGNAEQAVVAGYEYTLYKDAQLAEPIEYSDKLGVGNYYIAVDVVDDNYTGRLVLDCIIEKATPTVTVEPFVDGYEWNMPLSMLDLNNDSAVVQNALSSEVVIGTFSLMYDGMDYNANTTFEEEFKAGGATKYQRMVTIVFTPSSDYIDNYASFSYEWTLTVNRVTLGIASFRFDNTTATYTASALYPTVMVYIDGAYADYSDMVDYSETPIVTGDYMLAVSIAEDNLLYRGSVTTDFTIDKRTAADIDVVHPEEYLERGEEHPMTAWSGIETTPSSIFRLTSDDIAAGAPITYDLRVTRGATVNAKIVDVGKYTVTITLTGNYTGVKTFDFVVRYKDVTYRDAVDGVITRTYTADSTQTGRVVADAVTPSNLSYTIEYAPLRGAYSTTVPYEAGTYHARLHFDGAANQGYDGYDNGVRIIIKPATTSITVDRLKDFVYTGKPLDAGLYINECFEVTASHASITSYKYWYSTTGAEDSWTDEPMTDAGDYYLLVEPANTNFEGRAVYQYTIAKGDIEYLGSTQLAAPKVETVDISYSAYKQGDNDNAYFTTASLSALTFAGEIVEGYFIIKDRESLSTLYRGTYDNFEYIFVPTGDNGANLNSYVGRVTINIVRLDISDYLTFDEASLKKTYNGSAQHAVVRFKTAAELGDKTPLALSAIVKDSIIASIKVRYGSSTNAPVNAGTYSLTADINHDNYSIANVTGTMIIDRALATIVKPDYFQLASSTVMDEANNTALNALKTMYALSGQLAVAGTFEITGLSAESKDIVNVAFSPVAEIAANVDATTTTLRVVYPAADSQDCITTTPVVSTISTYGATLDSVLPTSEYGTYSWADGSIVPSVGTTTYTLTFMPYARDIADTTTPNYNVQTFDVQVVVAAVKELTATDLGTLYWDVVEGSAYSAGSIVITAAQYSHLTGFALSSLSIAGIDDIVKPEDFRSGTDVIATLSFVHADYVVTDVITAKVTLRLQPSAFRVSGNSAEYAGKAITKTDLYGGAQSLLTVTVTDAGVLPQFLLTIYNADGEEIEEIPSIGSYTIQLDIDRSMCNYAGSTTIVFTMTAEDLSDYILVNGKDSDVVLTKVYSQSLSIIPTLDLDALGGRVSADDYELIRYYKPTSAPDSEYSMYDIPYNAGSYDVKVVIASSDYYQGEKVFSYVIEKKAVSISLNGHNLVSGGGYVLRATYGSVSIPTLALGEGVKKYTITYADDSTTYLTTPANAGEYTATVTVTDDNYTGVANFTLSIAKRETVIIKAPTLASIEYGTLTRNAVMSSDWEIRVGDNRVDGSMEIVNGDSILNAGVNVVQVLFTPINANYESRLIDVELVVNRALDTLLTFNTTELVYTGEEIAISYTALSFVDVADISFYYYTLQGATLTAATPVMAGEYYVRVVVGSENGNYYYTNVPEGELGNSSKYQKIIIKKATAIGYVTGKEPEATDIEYGYALIGHSYITGDVAWYDDGKGGKVEVKGTYTFKNGNAPQYTVEEDMEIELVFTPANPNYSVYYCTTTIDVVKAFVTIEVGGGTTITYGDRIEGADAFAAAEHFSFSIDQHSDLVPNLTLDTYTWDNYVKDGKVLASGNYSFRVVLEHEHYQGELSFVLAVQKKTVELSFYTDNTYATLIDQAAGYSYAYQSNSNVHNVHAAVSTDLDAFAASIGEDAAAIRAAINEKVVLTYTHVETGKTYTNITNVFKQAGQYRVTATLLTSLDYTATAWTYLNVTPAKIGKIELDTYTLRQQTYGTVAEPIVYIYNDDANSPVRLTGVKYYIHWGDSVTMPTSAGEHPATVIIDDPNYQYTEKNILFVIKKKAITLKNITVKDKVHDGTPWVDISAEMSGAILGDEVGLNLTAHTEGKSTAVGKHNVTIFNYSLYGLHKDNYYIVTPAYNKTVEIYSNVIYDDKGESYVLFSGNAKDDYSFEVQEIESSHNRTGFISTILGQSAQVVAFSVRQDGLKVQLEEPVHVYVKIPEQYRNRVDLAYSFVGGEDEIVFNREGDYISFYTTQSGEIVFVTSAFPYGIILIAAGLVVLLAGILFIIFLDPARKKVGFSGIRRKTPVDEAYRKLTEQKIKRDNTPPPYEDVKKRKKGKK